MADPTQIVGQSPLRKEGRAKVLGRAQYVDDISLPGMWFGATVRSTIPRGRISSIAFDPSVPWHEFTIVTAADIPGENTIVHLAKDHPCLASTHVNHAEEPILLLAHPNRAVLPAAVAAVHITYEELPAIYTIEESEKKEQIIWGEGESANTFKTYLMQKDQHPTPDEIWQTADFIVEGEYRTGAQEQLYIENNGVIAEYDPENGLTVRGSMQCPYYLVHALELVFNLPAEKCRVIQTETGGAFGGKEDFPSVIGSHAALLAMNTWPPPPSDIPPAPATAPQSAKKANSSPAKSTSPSTAART
jgi:CO/xanthine dehydrogenase Mo-binding subunit